MLKILAVSLALTLAFEEGFALAWGLRGRRELGLVALINCLTNPPVVLLYYTAAGLWHWNAAAVTLVLEAAAVLAEWRCCVPSSSRCSSICFPMARGASSICCKWRICDEKAFDSNAVPRRRAVPDGDSPRGRDRRTGGCAVLRHAVSAVGPGGSCPGRHGVSIAEILEKEKVRCFT